jgi:peptidoglycan/xylan/chitin deacetylase (PgdA/CDA1 family)
MLPRANGSNPTEFSIPILMYHSISPTASRQFRQFAVPPDQLEEHLRYMRENGYESMTVTGLMEALRQPQASLPVRSLVLTFDDGLEDFFTAAFPLLVKYAMVATLYIVTGYVGGRARWLARTGEGDRKMLNWSQIAEINRAGMEIGAHTTTHPMLDSIPLADARREICESKHELEDRLGERVLSFAYPFGSYDGAVCKLVEEAGYDSACAVHYAMCTRRDDRFALSRHIVRRDARGPDVGALLAGRAPLAPLLYDRARSNAWKMWRHTFGRVGQ